MAFMALTKCFCKNFVDFLIFAINCFCFVTQKLSAQIKDAVSFPKVITKLDNTFSCYLMSVMTLNTFISRRYRLFFEPGRFFILFL